MPTVSNYHMSGRSREYAVCIALRALPESEPSVIMERNPGHIIAVRTRSRNLSGFLLFGGGFGSLFLFRTLGLGSLLLLLVLFFRS